MKTLVMTGGGTAGHVTPCIALLEEMKKRFDRVIFIGGDGMEKDLVPKVMPFYSVPTVKFFRKEIYKNAAIPFVLQRGVRAAKKILVQNDACAVFSKGGYASLPACLAAKSLGVPVVCHESDYTLGLANKLESRFAKSVLTSFIETKGGTYVGNPIRKEIMFGDAERAKKNYGVGKKKVLLIIGGSSGSEALNRTIYKGLDVFLADYDVVHICGKTGDLSIRRDGYAQTRYDEDVADLYALAEVVVTRGGSNALNELAALGKKAVVVPLPKGESRGDQVLNARSYERRGFFTVLEQEDLHVETLLDRIKKAESNAQKATELTAANERIANIVASVALVR